MFNYNNLGFCDYCTFGGLYKGAKMEKLDYLYGQKKMPNTWQPCHVLEIVNYLKEKGYNYELYKETSKSKFILVNKNACLFYKTCAEICNALVDLYFLEKEEEEKSILKARIERDKKQNTLLAGVYLK